MSRKSRTHVRPKVPAVPRADVVESNTPTPTDNGFTALLENVMKPILAVAYWFEPDPRQESHPVTVRFSGHRLDVKGRLQAADRFVQDETIEGVVPGSGPISLTTRIRDINPGEWNVTAHILGSGTARTAQELKGQERILTVSASRPLLARIWSRWAPSVESAEKVSTCMILYAHVPGILPGIWAIMVTLGMALAFILQALLISTDHLAVGPWWAVTLGAIAVGIIGAKLWYIVTHRREHLKNGWCIQGFITGATLTAALLLLVLRVPAGVFLDSAAPSLLMAMAVGRVGCFFAGCCGGPPTASHWGVWSSDQRVGARRIPTQLMESVLALSLGLGALVAFQIHGSANGAFFVGALAAYTLVRQGILHLRAEPRKTKLGGPVTSVLATLVLLAAVVLLIR